MMLPEDFLTLQKYELKADIKSIKERLLWNENINEHQRFSYSEFLIKYLQRINGKNTVIKMDSDFRHSWEKIRNADISLLYQRAEQYELVLQRAEEVKQTFQHCMFVQFQGATFIGNIDYIIKGESK